MDDLAAAVQYLLDRQAILDCAQRYARALDRHDDELLTSVYHDDAIDNHGSWVGGRTEFVRWANHAAHGHLAAHLHHITTHSCEIDGDTAHTESYVQFVHRYPDGKKVLVGGGRYVDRLEKHVRRFGRLCEGRAGPRRRLLPAPARAARRAPGTPDAVCPGGEFVGFSPLSRPPVRP
jgi:hypothetical protein